MLYSWSRYGQPILAETYHRSQDDSEMALNLIDQVALALFASDGMKFASAEVSLEQSWESVPERHSEYRERAIVFIKVMGLQMVGLANLEISKLDEPKAG